MTRESWVDAHPYLRRVADLSAAVEDAAAAIDSLDADRPDWDDYRAEFEAGVPLLMSADVRVDLEPGGRMAVALLDKLADGRSPAHLAEECRFIVRELQRTPDASRRVTDFLQSDDIPASMMPPVLRYVGWTAMARFLRPVVDDFSQWADEDRWLRRYCSTCGSPPAMAQLVGVDPGRKRLLTCGRCATQWRFGRTLCPFCEADSQKLAGIEIEGESGLRIDYCESCNGYLKTYNGHGDEHVLLADWTSLHLDQLALDRGLHRKAVSLYDIESATAPAAALP